MTDYIDWDTVLANLDKLDTDDLAEFGIKIIHLLEKRVKEALKK